MKGVSETRISKLRGQKRRIQDIDIPSRRKSQPCLISKKVSPIIKMNANNSTYLSKLCCTNRHYHKQDAFVKRRFISCCTPNFQHLQLLPFSSVEVTSQTSVIIKGGDWKFTDLLRLRQHNPDKTLLKKNNNRNLLQFCFVRIDSFVQLSSLDQGFVPLC